MSHGVEMGAASQWKAQVQPQGQPGPQQKA